MDQKNNLKSVIQSFKYNDEKAVAGKRDKISKIKKVSKNQESYEDLQPSLANNLKLLFIGFNPGIQSSIQQHHYAHFTNLFWKLFNEARLLTKTLQSLKIPIEDTIEKDKFLEELVKVIDDGEYTTYVKTVHDFELVKYKIGFTDLVLRCTKSAQELTTSEKLANVPRLIEEFKRSETRLLVFIGKGIWEIVVKYVANDINLRFKITKANFKWGRQEQDNDPDYNLILQRLTEIIGYECNLYVFPNTSGLVTSLKYSEKLQLWNDLGEDVLLS